MYRNRIDAHRGERSRNSRRTRGTSVDAKGPHKIEARGGTYPGATCRKRAKPPKHRFTRSEGSRLWSTSEPWARISGRYSNRPQLRSSCRPRAAWPLGNRPTSSRHFVDIRRHQPPTLSRDLDDMRSAFQRYWRTRQLKARTWTKTGATNSDFGEDIVFPSPTLIGRLPIPNFNFPRWNVKRASGMPSMSAPPPKRARRCAPATTTRRAATSPARNPVARWTRRPSRWHRRLRAPKRSTQARTQARSHPARACHRHRCWHTRADATWRCAKGLSANACV